LESQYPELCSEAINGGPPRQQPPAAVFPSLSREGTTFSSNVFSHRGIKNSRFKERCLRLSMLVTHESLPTAPQPCSKCRVTHRLETRSIAQICNPLSNVCAAQAERGSSNPPRDYSSSASSGTRRRCGALVSGLGPSQMLGTWLAPLYSRRRCRTPLASYCCHE
jgi:hypothetical protein